MAGRLDEACSWFVSNTGIWSSKFNIIRAFKAISKLIRIIRDQLPAIQKIASNFFVFGFYENNSSNIG
jgi:hypothetical protein